MFRNAGEVTAVSQSRHFGAFSMLSDPEALQASSVSLYPFLQQLNSLKGAAMQFFWANQTIPGFRPHARRPRRGTPSDEPSFGFIVFPNGHSMHDYIHLYFAGILFTHAKSPNYSIIPHMQENPEPDPGPSSTSKPETFSPIRTSGTNLWIVH